MIWNTLKEHAGSQFLQVIEWLDDTRDTIAYRYPTHNQKITDQSKLVVREGQAALFVSEGKISDIFSPGTYTLDTRNTPIVSFFESIAYKLNYPYKGDVIFVSTRQFLQNPWGTPNPIAVEDEEFGIIEVRGHGVYSYKISDPALFVREIVGTDGLFTTAEINGHIKEKLVAIASDVINESKVPPGQLAGNNLEFSEIVTEKGHEFCSSSYGLTITDFIIKALVLSDELREALKIRSRMRAIGDMGQYAQMKAADALETAAGNEGLAGAGVGMGVGFGVGNMMGNAFGGMGQQSQAPATPPPVPSSPQFHYNGPGGSGQKSVSDIIGCILANRSGDHKVWAAGWAGWKSWSEVPEIAGQIPPASGDGERYHYNGPGGSGEKSLSEIVAAVQAAPDADHKIWKQGFAEWKSATEVEAIAKALGAGGPPPLPDSGGPPPLP